MTVSTPDGQLELFDLSGHPTIKPRQRSLGRLVLQIRQDQLVVAGIASLVGFTMVFALGVERGKQLVRSERVLLAREQTLPVGAPPAANPEISAGQAAKPAAKTAKPATSAPTAPVKLNVPKKLAASQGSRYAIQVVSYRQPQLAKRELDRLQAKGERAFLVTRKGFTVLCVGPFPSKDNAKEKLMQLKDRYQGCFLKTL
ncbi:MAG: SPOR domain-containing protein [Candidatus Omnitrophica bacterium]|nr:SPOR domain-containing protein [Candidatus Omnitrophota bacterium]